MNYARQCPGQRQTYPNPYQCGEGCHFDNADTHQQAMKAPIHRELKPLPVTMQEPEIDEGWELTPLGWAVALVACAAALAMVLPL